MTQPVLRVRLFGDVGADYDGRPVRVAARPLCAVLLAMLITRPNTRLRRDVLAADLWPDESDPARVKANLRRHLSTLSAALPALPGDASWIEADGANLMWVAERPAWCDATAFEAALADPNAPPEAFVHAGDFMCGYTTDWVVAQRENYRARAVERLLALCIARQDDDRLEEALACANAVLRIDPLCEEAVQLAIDLHGERGEALAAGQLFSAFAERLRRELDAAPSKTTVASLERVRGAGNKSAERLPRALTSFVGRRAEVESVTEALERNRCVTVVGPGGAGKTRLALETARGVARRFADGTAFVDLSALPGGNGIDDAAIRSLELPSELSAAGRAGIERFLRNRRVLLILDNCEHVREAGAAFASAVLACAPRVTILATSREPLAIEGEAIYRLGPLSRAEARALFLERSRRADAPVDPDDAELGHIERICTALDCSPLAVELAAGLARSLAPADIEHGLTDRFALLRSRNSSRPHRHRTLKDTIAWSYDLLEEAERELFKRLAVFPASFTFEAALAICETTAPALRGLVEKSMVQRDDASSRYRLLFSLAAFAKQRFEHDRAADGVRRRHAEHYAELLAFAESGSHDGLAGWLGRVESELENVRAALDYLMTNEPARGVRAVLALSRFFDTRGLFVEAQSWLEAALSHAEPGTHEYARIRFRFGRFSTRRQAFAEASDAVTEAATIFRSAGDEEHLARALAELGAIRIWCNEPAAALAPLAEAQALAARRGLRDVEALVHANLGVIAIAERDYARATERLTLAARLFKGVGDRRKVADMLHGLAGFDFAAGRYAAARDLLDEALETARAIRDGPEVVAILCDMGDVLLAEGRPAEARRYFDEALAQARPLGLPFATGHALLGFAGVAAATGEPRLAARLVGAAADFTGSGMSTDISDVLLSRTRAAALAHIDEAEFERERRLGELLELENALELAASVMRREAAPVPRAVPSGDLSA